MVGALLKATRRLIMKGAMVMEAPPLIGAQTLLNPSWLWTKTGDCKVQVVGSIGKGLMIHCSAVCSHDGRERSPSSLAGCLGLQDALYDAEIIFLFNQLLKQCVHFSAGHGPRAV